jgi:OmpA-OmpF porin, OOP family
LSWWVNRCAGALPCTCWLLLALGGCATPASRVTLLPQADGAHGGVTVKAGDKTQTLTEPYQAAAVDSRGGITAQTVSAQELRQRHAQLLARQPPAPQRFVLYFLLGSDELTPDSAAQLPAVLQAVQAYPGGELVVMGHTDRVGTIEDNDSLSKRRAQAIRRQLIASGVQPELIEAVGRGEREPLVPTADEIYEPRNRRTEILVR